MKLYLKPKNLLSFKCLASDDQCYKIANLKIDYGKI